MVRRPRCMGAATNPASYVPYPIAGIIVAEAAGSHKVGEDTKFIM